MRSIAIEDSLKGDFRKFLYYTWNKLGLPSPTPVQYDIAHYLQTGPRRRIIEAFRGVGKSWITSAYVCWRLLRNPDEKILVVSASKTRADDFSLFTKRLISELPVLAHLKARPGQRDSNIAFDVGPTKPAHAPSVKSVGITGQMTGSRATLIIADDIESLNNSLTQTQRDKLLETVKEFDAVLMPGGEINYLGTPQTELSIYNTLAERGYQVRIWPARYPKETELNRYQGRLAPIILDKVLDGAVKPGIPTDPKRFNDLDLREREASYGRTGFALQFMLDTSLSDMEKYPLKISDFIVFNCDNNIAPVKLAWASGRDQILDLPSVGFTGDRWYKPMYVSPEWDNYQGCVMAIDPSGRGTNETGYAVVKHSRGLLYLVASGGFRDGYVDNTLKGLANIAKRYGVNWIIIEDNFGDGMFTELFKPVLSSIYPCTIDPEGVRQSQRKELRIIDTLEPVLNQHRLVVDEAVIQADLKVEDPRYQLFYQLSRITKDKGSLIFDDRIDSLAIAVGYWMKVLGQNTEDNERRHQEELLQKELEKFSKHVLGYSSERHKFFEV